MPSIADQMKSCSVITRDMVRQAMQEAQSDPTQLTTLQGIVDQGGAVQQFEDPEGYEQLFQFCLDYQADKFVLRPNTENARPKQAVITEARITKVVDEKRTIDLTPPPPPPPVGRGRDPLNITGQAEAGAKVTFYNASEKGRPPLGEATVAPDGKWSFQLTDETKFVYGDQIGVTVVDGHGDKSKPVIVPTAPFEIKNVETTFTRYRAVVEVRNSVEQRALAANTDVRPPFYQDNKVQKQANAPANVGEPWSLELRGGDDAVEPNATITARIGSEVYTTKAADDGTYALKVRGFTPGDVIRLEIRDLNNQGMDVSYQTSPVQLDMSSFTGGMFAPPSMTAPHADQTVGTSPPWIGFKAKQVTEPFGAVVVRNRSTGDVFELKANDKGDINAALGGVSKFDVLEIAGRDVNGVFSPKTEWAVVLPEKLAGAKGFLVPTDTLDRQSTADVTKVIESIKGPPMDRIMADGKPDPRGPFLRMPDTCGLPPFGQLAVLRDGAVVQTLRADADGRLTGLLKSVRVDDQLNFRILDAAGRQFPGEVVGWRVPDAGKTNKVSATILRPDDRTISGALAEVGKGTLDVNHEWLKPFTLNAQQPGTAPTQVKLHYPMETFGAPKRETEQAADIQQIAAPIAAALGGVAVQGPLLSIRDDNGTKRIDVNYIDAQGNNGTIGIDYVMGQVNAGNANRPLAVPGGLAAMTGALKQTLTIIAGAYDQGKEPGDPSYERAVAVAKSILYVFDRLAVANPAQKDEITAAAKAAFPAKGFAYELIDRRRVPPHGTAASGESVSGKRSSTLSLIDARAAALGKVDVPTTASGVQPPRVDSAIVLAAEQGAQGVPPAPLRVKGRAQAGDIVQVFNYSTAGRTLLAETIAGADGTYNIVAAGIDVRPGDKLGILAVRDGKKSKTQLVPTDSYFYQQNNLQTARPVIVDNREPFIQLGKLDLENTSFDASGKMRGSSPTWRLSGGDVAVEPLAKVRVESTTPDGRAFQVEVQADEEGRFTLEFPSMAFTGFRVVVTDDGGKVTAAPMRTPGLSDTKKLGGDDANDMASGAITLHLPSGDVKGVIVEHSWGAHYGNGDRNIQRIPEADRNDKFADVVLQVPYKQVYNNGGVNDTNVTVRLKVPAEEAKKLTLQVAQKISITSATLATLPVDKANNSNQQQLIEVRQEGEVLVLDRDYVLDN